MAVQQTTLSAIDPKRRNIDKIFENLYQKLPEFYVRVPGRVNLIGEHVDYSGYAVCPMALDQDIFLAVATVDGNKQLILHNTDKGFERFETELIDNNIVIDVNGTPKWYQYYLSGVAGVLQLDGNEVKGLQVLVSGNVPQCAGLSSSSALVSAAALATSKAFNNTLIKDELADLCAASERFIGTQGGGMDQAIAFLAEEGNAKLITFNPLKAQNIRLPSGAVFVIAHSLAKLNKAATKDFNCRVVECRLAGQVIAKLCKLNWKNIHNLSELQRGLNKSFEEMIEITVELLRIDPYSQQDIAEILEVNVEDLPLTPNTKNVDSFKLQQRARHVFEEASRVDKFHKACNEFQDESTLITLGKLMSDSHKSLKDLYECSHPQLDRIVELAEGYTLGTRLTGAGWGGCTVSLVTQDSVDNFKSHLIETFYKPLGMISNNYDSVLFTTAPKGGATIFLP